MGSALWGGSADAVQIWNSAGPGNNLLTSNPVGVADYHIAAVRYDNVASDGNLSVINIDGDQEDTDDTVQNHASQVITIGNHGSAHGLDGKIAEAIVYNGSLTDEEIDCVEAYLGDK